MAPAVEKVNLLPDIEPQPPFFSVFSQNKPYLPKLSFRQAPRRGGGQPLNLCPYKKVACINPRLRNPEHDHEPVGARMDQ
jgi:hypothetical protein